MKQTEIFGKFIVMISATIIVTGLAACIEDADISAKTSALTSVLGGEYCVPLIAGQNIDAGTVCADVVGDNMVVTYDTTGGWELIEAHLWVGASLTDMPQTKTGNPKVGNFPYNSGDISGSVSYAFSVPLVSLGGEPAICGQSFYIAAHAALRKLNPDTGSYQTQTGWGDGLGMVEKGSWATYFMVTLQCNSAVPEPEKQCETAFAYGGDLAIPFTSLMDTPRWGWSNGPLGPGSYSFDIYAGAGQNDLTKGTLVGTLAVVYDGSTATVTYNVSSGFTMDETHLWAGSTPLALNNGEPTVAPGQYGNSHELSDASSDSFTVNGLSDDIYIVAHAIVCE